MKKPKIVNRYCPFCKKHTAQKIEMVSSGHKRGSLRRGGIPRAKKRGLGIGFGSHGKWGSKPAISSWKRKIKTVKKTNLMFTCQTCKKSVTQKKGKRAGKFKLE
jgi:large subunit ribosomal protein L44e